MFELNKYRGVTFDGSEYWWKIWRKNDLCFQNMRNLAHFHQSMFGSGVFTGEFCVMKMKNDAKFEDEMTCQFKIDLGIWRILTWTLKKLKNLHFNGLLLTKVYNIWARKSKEELCLMALNTEAKFQWKMTCAFWKFSFTAWEIAISI